MSQAELEYLSLLVRADIDRCDQYILTHDDTVQFEERRELAAGVLGKLKSALSSRTP